MSKRKIEDTQWKVPKDTRKGETVFSQSIRKKGNEHDMLGDTIIPILKDRTTYTSNSSCEQILDVYCHTSQNDFFANTLQETGQHIYPLTDRDNTSILLSVHAHGWRMIFTIYEIFDFIDDETEFTTIQANLETIVGVKTNNIIKIVTREKSQLYVIIRTEDDDITECLFVECFSENDYYDVEFNPLSIQSEGTKDFYLSAFEYRTAKICGVPTYTSEFTGNYMHNEIPAFFLSCGFKLDNITCMEGFTHDDHNSRQNVSTLEKPSKGFVYLEKYYKTDPRHEISFMVKNTTNTGTFFLMTRDNIDFLFPDETLTIGQIDIKNLVKTKLSAHYFTLSSLYTLLSQLGSNISCYDISCNTWLQYNEDGNVVKGDQDKQYTLNEFFDENPTNIISGGRKLIRKRKTRRTKKTKRYRTRVSRKIVKKYKTKRK
jgi:hypothetical protein